MKIIGRKRLTGKTMELIRMSARSGAVIACVGGDQVREVKELAKKLKLDIPEPTTHLSLKRNQGRGLKAVLIDDVEFWAMLFLPLGLEVEGMVFSITEEEDVQI